MISKSQSLYFSNLIILDFFFAIFSVGFKLLDLLALALHCWWDASWFLIELSSVTHCKIWNIFHIRLKVETLDREVLLDILSVKGQIMIVFSFFWKIKDSPIQWKLANQTRIGDVYLFVSITSISEMKILKNCFWEVKIYKTRSDLKTDFIVGIC